MKRCKGQGKRKFRDPGEAARHIDPGEWARPYRCPHCGFWHLTTHSRKPTSDAEATRA